MVPERLLSIVAELPSDQLAVLTHSSDGEKLAFSLFSGGANLFLSWFVSRQMEGTLNNKYEKAAIIAGGIGITAANAIINHQVWT